MKTNSRLYPASSARIITPDSSTEIDMLQCVHCGGHFELRPGSGKVRGFCMRCNGPVCGPQCAECVPFEQFLENREAGKPDNHRPVRVSLSGLILPG